MTWLKLEPVTSRTPSGCSTFLNMEAARVSVTTCSYSILFCSTLYAIKTVWPSRKYTTTFANDKAYAKAENEKWKNNSKKRKKTKKKLHKTISNMNCFAFEACFVFTHVHKNLCKISEIFKTEPDWCVIIIIYVSIHTKYIFHENVYSSQEVKQGARGLFFILFPILVSCFTQIDSFWTRKVYIKFHKFARQNHFPTNIYDLVHVFMRLFTSRQM